jgi:hypothetical protein
LRDDQRSGEKGERRREKGERRRERGEGLSVIFSVLFKHAREQIST